MAFHDVRFPDKILRGAVGGPRGKTTIGTTDSGFEQRNQDWAQSRRRWVVGRKVTSADQLKELLSFVIVRGFRAHGFLFRDPSDFYVGLAHTPGTGLAHDPAAIHVFATGDGAEVDFQLKQVYTSGAYSVERKITRPLDPGRSDAPEGAVAVKVYVDGVEEPDVTIDYSTGIVTFDDPPGDTLEIGWCGMFDCPVRFDTDEAEFDVDAMFKAGWPGIPIVELRE